MGIDDFDSANSFLRRLARPAAAVAVVSVLGLSGCSSVPDAMNPAEWYRDTVDFFAGEDEDQQQAREGGGVSEDVAEQAKREDYPSLASVPERPQPREGLVGDVQGRRYAEPVQRQGEAEETMAELADTPPAPPAQPTAEVTSEPLDQEKQARQPQQPQSAPAQTASRSRSDEGPADVMSVYRRNLAQQRPDPNASGYQPPQDSAADDIPRPSMERPEDSFAGMFAQPGPGESDFGTVVISSQGVEAAAMPSRGSAVAGDPVPQVRGGESDAGFTRASLPASGQGVVQVATILFDTGKAGLSAREKGILRKVRDLQKRYGARLHVVGHASSRTRNMDPVRHKMVNYQVSAERADMVAATLARLGVPQEKLSVDAKSDSQPRYYEIMPSGEAGNRRAEVYLVY